MVLAELWDVLNPKPVLKHVHTNECLDAVVQGLDVQPNDVILSIGGSGEQAFALLDKARKVIVADRNPAQIKYIEKQIRMLQDRGLYGFSDLDEFSYFVDGNNIPLPSTWNSSRPEYFTTEIIGNIIKKLYSLEVHHSEISSLAKKTKFNKAYLSNAFEDKGAYTSLLGFLKKIAHKFPVNGLVYSNGSMTIFDHSLDYGFEIDKELTEKAISLEDGSKDAPWWKPVVCRKVK